MRDVLTEPASVLPRVETHTHFLIEANAYTGIFTLYFVAGPGHPSSCRPPRKPGDSRPVG